MKHRHHGRWLHARISETLEEALKREARRRRLPVSLLVRDVLEGALDLVEDIVGARPAPARAAAGRAPSADDRSDVYGWQELILNRSAACARCEAVLAPGGKAYRGLRDRSGPPVFQCAPCVRRRRDPSGQQEERT